MKPIQKQFHRFEIGETVYLKRGIESRRDCPWIIKAIDKGELPFLYVLTKPGSGTEWPVPGKDITIEKMREEK